jgi:hypothetical protein
VLLGEKTIAPGVGIHIVVFDVCSLFGFACRLPRKNEEALLSPVWVKKKGNKRRAFLMA